MRRLSLVLFTTVLLILLFFLMAIDRSQSSYSKTLAQNRELLLPPAATATVAVITENEWSKIAEWTIDTGLSWNEYQTWISKRNGGTYRVLSRTDAQMRLRKTFHSEIHEIKLTDEEGKVRVFFSISLW